MNYKKYVTGLLFLGLLSGCSEEFLDRPPLDQIVNANFYQTTEQVLAGTGPLYNLVWFGYVDKAAYGIGDGRGGVFFSPSFEREHVQLNSQATQESVVNAWRSFYNIVGQSNNVITSVNKYVPASVPDNIKRHALAEARFMRGTAYSFLVQNFGPVPIIANNETLLTDTTVTRNTVPSVWDFIIRDIRYAAKNLPDASIQPGRLNRYAAEGMLAKMFLTRAGVESGGTRRQTDLDSAAYYANRVISSGRYRLMENYGDLFKTANNNNAESMFALQWVYNGGAQAWGTQNATQAYLAFGSQITGFGDGWGQDHGATMDMLKRYEPADTRRKATYMFPGDVYPEITEEVNDPNNPGKKIKRPLQVTTNNNNTADFKSRANIKKYVVGRPEDNAGKVVQMGTEINTYMLRYADVLLIYAEAILGNNASTTDPKALAAFNAVRTRAGLAPVTSINWEQIYNERRLEFAMEGQAWYDITRIHYYNPTRAYQLLQAQDRGTYRIYPNQKVNATAWTIESVNPAFYSVDANSFHVPYPAVELTRAPNLLKAPVPYKF